MTIESTAAPKAGRIAGTLHKRGYVPPVALRDEKLPRERAEEGEVEGRHQNTGRKDLKGAC